MSLFTNYIAPSCVLCYHYTGPKKIKWCFYCHKVMCYDCVKPNEHLDISCLICKEPSLHFCSKECRSVITEESGLKYTATDKCQCNCFFECVDKEIRRERERKRGGSSAGASGSGLDNATQQAMFEKLLTNDK